MSHLTGLAFEAGGRRDGCQFPQLRWNALFSSTLDTISYPDRSLGRRLTSATGGLIRGRAGSLFIGFRDLSGLGLCDLVLVFGPPPSS